MTLQLKGDPHGMAADKSEIYSKTASIAASVARQRQSNRYM